LPWIALPEAVAPPVIDTPTPALPEMMLRDVVPVLLPMTLPVDPLISTPTPLGVAVVPFVPTPM
jgi:hypothetical protein